MRRHLCFFIGEDDVTLFVKNIAFSVSKEALAAHFEGCVDARMPLRDDGSIKG